MSNNYVCCPVCGTRYPVKDTKIVCLCNGVQNVVCQAPEQWLPSLKCEYQEELVGKVDCNCAATKPVYKCSIHTYCTPRTTIYNQIKTLEGDVLSVTPKGCSKCQEKKCGQSK